VTGRTAPSITVRPYDPPRDAARYADLLNQLNQSALREPYSAERVLEWERLRAPGTLHRSLVAETTGTGSHVVAVAAAGRAPWARPERVGVECVVDAAHRRQGIASLLVEQLTTFAAAHGATQLSAEVRDDDQASLAFAQHRGFETERHVFESTLDLTTFDETPHLDALAKAEAAGIVFRSLVDYGDTEPARRKLYDLNTANARDVPGFDGADRPWDEFKKIFTLHWFRPDGQVLAVDPSASPDPTTPNIDHDRFVALAAIGYFKDSNSVYHMHTGTHRDYRGRGLALATKLVALRRAKEWGAAFARTNNDSTNAPILAVNRKLGYRPQPGFYRLLKPLA
jgi:GNAT superfamily N-acetyltransferase